MKRIDPAAVPDVFRRRGLRPATGVFVGSVEAGQCCVLSALYCDAKGCQDPKECLAEIEAMRVDDEPACLSDRLAKAIDVGCDDEDGYYDSNYADGVIFGWDDEGLDIDFVCDDSHYERGIRDGIAARRAVAEAGLGIVRLSEDDDDEDDLDFDEDDDDDLDFDDFDDEDDDEEDGDE